MGEKDRVNRVETLIYFLAGIAAAWRFLSGQLQTALEHIQLCLSPKVSNPSRRSLKHARFLSVLLPRNFWLSAQGQGCRKDCGRSNIFGMTTMNRRELCGVLSSLAALAAAGAVEVEGQDAMAVPAPPGSAGDRVLADSRAFRFGDLPLVKNVNGETRAVVHGVLPTGEAVAVHETTLLPGHMPHPPHQHRHSEFMMVREGEMEFENNGTPQRVGPGGVMYAASMVLHGLKNVGATTANYFVIEIGRDAPVQRA